MLLLHDQRLTVRMAKYVYVVLEVFSSTQMFIPAPCTYMPLAAAQGVRGMVFLVVVAVILPVVSPILGLVL